MSVNQSDVKSVYWNGVTGEPPSLDSQKEGSYFLTPEGPPMKPMVDQILSRVRRRGRGAVFTPKDFLDLGSRAAVDQALSRLVKAGGIRRLARGIYDFPRMSPRLGVLSPAPEAIAKAVAQQTDSAVQITGAQAANALGLSMQVPAQPVYLTDGPSRRVKVGQRVIQLRHASPRTLVAPGSRVGTVVQALKYLGPADARAAVGTLASRLSPADRRILTRKAAQAPGWMRPVLRQIAAS